MFKVSTVSLQIFTDTPNCVLEDLVRYNTVHIPNVFCDGHLQLINCVGTVRIHWVFHRTPEKRIGRRKIRQGQGDTRITLTPSVIPNYNYVITVGDRNCLKYWIFACFCTVIVRCTETFWSPCIINWQRLWITHSRGRFSMTVTETPCASNSYN